MGARLAFSWCALYYLAELEELLVSILALESLQTLGLFDVLRLDAGVIAVGADLRNDASALHALCEAADEVCRAFASGLFYLYVG